MKRSFHWMLILVLLLPIEFLLIPSASAAVKAGAPCAKRGSTSILNSLKFTCVKSGKKFVWSKGVKLATPDPIPNYLTIDLEEHRETPPPSDPQAALYCNQGGYNYKDISATTGFEIRDGNGGLLATGVLGNATVINRGEYVSFTDPWSHSSCLFKTVIKLKKSNFYQIKIGTRYDTSFSFDDLVRANWKISLQIG